MEMLYTKFHLRLVSPNHGPFIVFGDFKVAVGTELSMSNVLVLAALVPGTQSVLWIQIRASLPNTI